MAIKLTTDVEFQIREKALACALDYNKSTEGYRTDDDIVKAAAKFERFLSGQ